MPVTAAKIAFAATVPTPKPPLILRNIALATSNASRPMPASDTMKPISTNSGTTPKK